MPLSFRSRFLTETFFDTYVSLRKSGQRLAPCGLHAKWPTKLRATQGGELTRKVVPMKSICCRHPRKLSGIALQRRPPRATRGWSKDETPSGKRPGSRIGARAIEKAGSVSCCRRRGSQMSVLWRASARHPPMTARPWAEAHGCTLKRAPLGLSGLVDDDVIS